MRSNGVLRSWDDERGFGFIAPTQGGAELFVHISAFARDGSRPVIGETVSFELGRGKDGRPQAVKVIRAVVESPHQPIRGRLLRRSEPSWQAWVVRALALCVVVAAGGWGYRHYEAVAHRRDLEAMPAVQQPAAPQASARFRCDGRTQCSQMTSCAEATWFINNCPGTQMDGDHDGVPCEQQWCTGSGAR